MAVKQVEFQALIARVASLERELQALRATVQARLMPQVIPIAQPQTEKERIRAYLRAQGLVSQPTLYEVTMAEEWFRLPEREKRKHRKLMDSLRLDPPLSQIILEARR